MDAPKDRGDLIRELQQAVQRLEEANRELAIQEERLRLAAESSDIGVWDYDLQTGEMYVSPVWKRQLGYADHEIRASFEDWNERLHPEDRERLQSTIEAYLKAPWPLYETEFRLRHRDGSYRWILSRASLRLDEAGRPSRMLGSHLDITDRKRDEEQRLKLEAQLLQAQKMEALGTLAGGIAHDFNNLLGAILGNAQLARTDLPEDHSVQVSVREILKAAHRARDLVQRILTFSAPDEHHFLAVKLEPVIREAATLLRATLPAGVELAIECEGDLPPVRANASQVHQCIMNLATNAWHALPEGRGRITIRLSRHEVDARRARDRRELKAGSYQLLSVADAGVGMDAATAARVFEPFFTTKPPGRGTGLGLSIIHSIMRNHGGAVLLDTAPGQGATFNLYFPLGPLSDSPVSAHVPNLPERKGRGECILLVDDDDAMLFMARRYLSRCGYRVDAYAHPDDALRAFETNPHSFDLVITDLNMPGMSGHDLAARMLRTRPDANVVLTSGYVSNDDAAKARQIGVREIVLKPNTIEELVPLVHGLLAARDRASSHE